MILPPKRMVIFTVLFVSLGGMIAWELKTVHEASFQSPETILVWVDCDAQLNSDQLFNLTRSVYHTGARPYGATFSANGDYIWLLFETTSDKVDELASINNVLNVSIAEETRWKWDLWWHYRKISPVLELQAKRMRAECPDEEIDVDLRFSTTKDKEINLNNTITLVESLGGNVTWVGLLETEGVGQVFVLISLEAIDVLAAHDSIRALRPITPLIPG